MKKPILIAAATCFLFASCQQTSKKASKSDTVDVNAMVKEAMDSVKAMSDTLKARTDSMNAIRDTTYKK
jgi:hypothetical protein